VRSTALSGHGTDTGFAGPADRATLTASYLDEVARRGETAADLLAVMPATGMLAARYGKRFMSRPLFLSRAEADQVNSDLQHIRTAMASLPDLRYDGDLAAFARDAGLTEVQIEAALRTRAGQVTDWVRADMYPDAHGFRLLEFNMGSGVAGSDAAEIARAMLRYPLLREFARAQRLTCVDTIQEQIRLILAESGFTRESAPMIALIDWPAHYERISGFLHKISRRWRDTGLDTHAGHLGHLKVRDGRVWLRGRPVDILFRIFLSEHLLEPGGPELMFPVIDAVARGEVKMFTPLDGELYGSKAPLAMLSDHANRHLFSPAQQDVIDRVLPWTRMMRPGPVALEDGSTVDLMEHALGHPADLVLKPTLLHGGAGVVAGWDTTAQGWRDALSQAMGGPYVLQRRIMVIPEMCPGEDGEPVPWETTWGIFTSEAGFGGVYGRGFRPEPGTRVGRIGTHLRMGGALVGPPGPG
jgi:hypothetical protein